MPVVANLSRQSQVVRARGPPEVAAEVRGHPLALWDEVGACMETVQASDGVWDWAGFGQVSGKFRDHLPHHVRTPQSRQ